MSLLYKTSVNRPYHLSVGCVLLDHENKVVCHKHMHSKLGEIHVLMRESIEPGESLEQTLSRGLQEEMGAEAEIVAYIGSITANDVWFGEIGQPTPVQKTTVYFLAQLKNLDLSKRLSSDPESKSEIIRIDAATLAQLMEDQSIRTGIQDINESSVVINAQNLLTRIT